MINLNQIKQRMSFESYLQEVHADLFPELAKEPMIEDFEGWLCELDIAQLVEYGEKYSKAFADRLVSEVEKAVVPEEEVIDDREPFMQGEINRQEGWNHCRTKTQEAFARFKGESQPEEVTSFPGRKVDNSHHGKSGVLCKNPDCHGCTDQ
jgi:hypothetical protein